MNLSQKIDYIMPLCHDFFNPCHDQNNKLIGLKIFVSVDRVLPTDLLGMRGTEEPPGIMARRLSQPPVTQWWNR